MISICMENGRLEMWICSVIVKCNNLEIFVRWGECFQSDRFLWHCNVILLAALHFLARRIQEHRSRALVEVDRVVFQLNKYKDIESFMPCATWAPMTWVQSRSITFSKGLPSCVAPVGLHRPPPVGEWPQSKQIVQVNYLSMIKALNLFRSSLLCGFSLGPINLNRGQPTTCWFEMMVELKYTYNVDGRAWIHVVYVDGRS